MQSNRGLTKGRRKDRKTPHTNRKAKFKRGEQKAKSQTKRYIAQTSDKFTGGCYYQASSSKKQAYELIRV